MKFDSTVVNKEVYKQNEIDSNKGLARGCIITGIILLIAWILYLTGVFKVPSATLKIINIFFPTTIVIMESTIIYLRTKFIKMKGFKYFLIVQFIVVTLILNVIIPKHGILMWSVCIVLVCHYFNPKIALFTYIVAALSMLIGIYFGMLLGEWDANLMNGANVVEFNGQSFLVDEASFKQRVDWLDYRRSLGDDRYLKAFTFYYLPRLLTLSLIAIISFGVSKRALMLLLRESMLVKDNERISSELDVASSIQASVLPKELEGTDSSHICGFMSPAKEIGGDFYDYFYIDETHIALVIGDVSGKGIPASLFMMKTETLIKSLTLSLGMDTAKIMERCNIALCDNNDVNMFVTCWLGILNLTTGELKFTNAGHNKVIFIKDNKAIFDDSKPGVILGAFEGSKYNEKTMRFVKNDKLVLYTDGVTEAHNDLDELYGEKRLLSFSEKYKNLTPRDYVKALRNDLEKYANGALQFDDITMLVYEYSEGVPIVESRTFTADPKELDNLFEYSSSLLRVLNFTSKDITMINVALEEVFVNVCKYAYSENGSVEITLSRTQDKITFVFKDSGKPFNPLDRKDPNITLSSDEREIGGLGIFMVKRIMDDVSYEYKDNQNVLTLIKYKKN